MQLRFKIEYVITAALLRLCRKLPLKSVYGLFRGFGGIMYYILADRTKLSVKNMEFAFPEKSLKERKQMAKASYLNISESMAFNTLMMSGRISNQELLDAVEIVGWENYEKAASLTDKGLCVISSHIGNWELVPQFAALRLKTQIHVITRETNNPLLEEKIVKPLRERLGVHIFHKKNALIRMLKAIKRGEHTGLMVDQKLSLNQGGINIKFFGKDAPTTAAPAFMQVRYGVVVLPAFVIRIGKGKYRMVLREPITWEKDDRAVEVQVKELTEVHQKVVEDIIREYPEQWFWMHNRWSLKRSER